MLIWASEFPIDSKNDVEDLLALAKKWISGSPHSNWDAFQFSPEFENEITKYEHEGQIVLVAKMVTKDIKWVGFKHKWVENNEKDWTTEIVGYKSHDGLFVSIQLHCDILKTGLPLPKAHKPYIVKQILEELGGGDDGGIVVSDKPIILSEYDVEIAANLIKGEKSNKLPIVYASAPWNRVPAIDVERIAIWSAGLAHVIVEPSGYFSHELAQHVNRANAYNGAVSIYWPGGLAHPVRFLPEKHPSPARMATAIADCLQKAMATIRPNAECTWDYIVEQLSRHRIENLKNEQAKARQAFAKAFDDAVAKDEKLAKAEQEIGRLRKEMDDFINAVDDEDKAKKERLDKAEKEINRLGIQLQRVTATANAAQNGILKAGKEKPFYPGELSDAVIKALQAGRNHIFSDGRCQHIIDDLLRNNMVSKYAIDIEDNIKSIISTAKELGSEEKRGLESLGFSFGNSGKHISMVYHEDPRYTFTVQRTGSDWRGMKNLSSDIIRKLFK